MIFYIEEELKLKIKTITLISIKYPIDDRQRAPLFNESVSEIHIDFNWCSSLQVYMFYSIIVVFSPEHIITVYLLYFSNFIF